MITVGVIFLFYLSSLGGFGGNSSLSWWWGLLILPYPIGWLMDVIMLIIRAYRKKPETVRG
jgi:ABC-type multidrug transport system permease subunit